MLNTKAVSHAILKCRECGKLSRRGCSCPTYQSSKIPPRERRKVLCSECEIIPTQLCDFHKHGGV